MKESGFKVLHDDNLDDKFPCEFDYKLLGQNDFRNLSNDEIPSDQNIETNTNIFPESQVSNATEKVDINKEKMGG